jgi:hypothetical protein
MSAIGWPPPIYRGRYKNRDTKAYQKFKRKLMRDAIERRSQLLKSSDTEPSIKQTA